MKMAITQREITIRGTVYDCLERGWYELLKQHEIIPVPNDYEYDISFADCLILSGGETTEAREFTETYCFSQAITRNIPVIGVCHGAFVLNRWHGGTNTKIDGHRGVDHTVQLEGSEHVVNSYHATAINTLGQGLTAIATWEESVEAFKHNELPVWGIVWHPERMANPVLPKELKELLLG